jgi:hypothetical protein
VLAIFVPLVGTWYSSYLTYKSSEGANVLKEEENRMKRHEMGLREIDMQLRFQEADAKRASSKKEREAKLSGVLTRLYAAFLSGDDKECIALSGEFASLSAHLDFSRVDSSKQKEQLEKDHESVRRLCIDLLANPDSRRSTRRRTDIEDSIDRLGKQVWPPSDRQ